MTASRCVSVFLAGSILLSPSALADESAPPPIAKLSEKKFSNERYKSAILGKVSFRKGRKPLEPKEPLRATFTRVDENADPVVLDVKDGEGFILQAAPGTYRLRDVARLGRLYRPEMQFRVEAGSVVLVGVVDFVLGDEDRAAYSYEWTADTTVDRAVFRRHPELGKLMNSYAPASLFQGENVSLFAPTYPASSGKVREPKTLGAAAENGDVATARELVASGTDLNAPDGSGWAPLHSALRYGHAAIAEALLDRGASLSVRNPDGWTPLMFATRYGHPALAKRIIESGIDPNAAAKDGWTALMLAARNDQAENALLLLQKGADPNARTKGGVSPLMLAAGHAPTDVVETLLAKGADLSARDGDGWTPLLWALRYQRREAARKLVERGADIHATDDEGWTPLMYALRYGAEDVALLLLDKGARVNERNKNGWSPLHFALRNGATRAARRLIEAGADLGRTTSDGWTPLMTALRNDQGENARLLIEKGVDLDAKNQDGWTPLMMSLRYDQGECARLLAQKCKQLDEKDKDGWTALTFALRYGHPEAAATLLQRGAAFNYTVEGGWEPLLTALRYGQAENARKLIQKGANPKAKTDQGWSALMFAIEHDQPENARLLIEKGADPAVQSSAGDTALSLAKKKGHYELVRLLGGAEPAENAFTAAKEGSAAVAGMVKLPTGAKVVSAEDCAPGLNGVALCTTTVETAGKRIEAYDGFVASMKAAGWDLDQGAHAQTEDGTILGKPYWGYLGYRKQQPDGLTTLTFTFPGGAPPAAGRTRLEISYQRFPSDLKSATYSQVVATYPAGAQQCGTNIDVTSVSPTGAWQTFGVVDYRNHEPQFQCLGTRVTLKVPVTVGGIQYDAGTLLTVDKNGRWVAVKSWD